MMGQLLADHVSSGLIFVDDAGIIAFINAGAEQMLSVAREDVVGKRVHMLPLRTPLYKVLSENCRDYPIEISVDGAVLLVKSSEVFLAETAMRGELVELRDITEDKRERRQREEFVAMMTHDLKSPLTVMMGYIQAMRDSDSPGENNELFIEELDRSSHRLLGMIEDVLDAYRLEVGLLSICREETDLRELLAGCCRDISRGVEQKEIEFTCSIADNFPPMRVDSKQIVRVFANLLGNALKFTRRGGKISLTAECFASHVEIAVTDTGVGIPEKDLGRIFNKYFRARTAAGFKGTGLGLAISKAIVDAHNGTIQVESREGVGSRFTVILPAN